MIETLGWTVVVLTAVVVVGVCSVLVEAWFKHQNRRRGR